MCEMFRGIGAQKRMHMEAVSCGWGGIQGYKPIYLDVRDATALHQ